MINKNNLAFNHQPLTFKSGFTLIEMLVVISLIGILAALALVSFGSVQKQARDTARKSDIKQYQTALESYANLTSGLYPSRTSTTVVTTMCNDLNTKLEPDISCSIDPKMAADPTYYDYKYSSNGSAPAGSASATNYVIWAKLEGKSVTTYLVACSNGKIGTTTTVPAPVAGACPALTQL